MEYLNEAGVLTRDLQTKVDELSGLQSQIATSDTEIRALKDKIKSIKLKRVAARAALIADIGVTKSRLLAKQKRKRQLEYELARLQVTFGLSYHKEKPFSLFSILSYLSLLF